jgi:hypothetical protein
MKRLVLLLIALAGVLACYAQDIGYARRVIDTLASPYMDGRGYVNGGDRKAGDFIEQELKNAGALPFSGNYRQHYTFPMNSLPGRVEMSLGKKALVPGKEFVVWAATPAIKGKFRVKKLAGSDLSDPERFKRKTKSVGDRIVIIDKKGIEDKTILRLLDLVRSKNLIGAKGLAFLVDGKPGWSVLAGARQQGWPVIDLDRSAWNEKTRRISLDVESMFDSAHRASNVIAYVKGAVQPDTFLVFTAHYDHLGRMGQRTYYPGANDNASGTAMVLDLARYYAGSANPPYYSTVFCFLSGEEAGLKGAEYLADHPVFPPGQIKFLVNLDMVGTGSEGITMVNATVFRDAYRKMVQINAGHEYLVTVKERGESCNSDHCPFYKKGVPAVFLYSMGKEFGEYHNPGDKTPLPLTEYEDIFRLVVDFISGMNN